MKSEAHAMPRLNMWMTAKIGIISIVGWLELSRSYFSLAQVSFLPDMIQDGERRRRQG